MRQSFLCSFSVYDRDGAVIAGRRTNNVITTKKIHWAKKQATTTEWGGQVDKKQPRRLFVRLVAAGCPKLQRGGEGLLPLGREILRGNAQRLQHKPTDKREKDPILVVLHNLKGYDANLLFLSMANIEGIKMTCIPNNMENHIIFSLGAPRFIDSLNFLQASLDSLVKTCPAGVSEVNLTAWKKKRKLHYPLRHKGVYPYE